MDTPAPQPGQSPAPLGRRIGAHLLDSGLALAVAYLATMPIAFAYQSGFGDSYLLVCQLVIVGWVLLKDSWWPGQSLGKRVARISIAAHDTAQPASRLRCLGRQVIFTLAVAAIYLPAYFLASRSFDFMKQAVFSTILTVGAPVRLLGFLPAAANGASNAITIAHLLVLGFVVVELALVYRRGDRRRLVDLLAGVKVVDAKT